MSTRGLLKSLDFPPKEQCPKTKACASIESQLPQGNPKRPKGFRKAGMGVSRVDAFRPTKMDTDQRIRCLEDVAQAPQQPRGATGQPQGSEVRLRQRLLPEAYKKTSERRAHQTATYTLNTCAAFPSPTLQGSGFAFPAWLCFSCFGNLQNAIPSFPSRLLPRLTTLCPQTAPSATAVISVAPTPKEATLAMSGPTL